MTIAIDIVDVQGRPVAAVIDRIRSGYPDSCTVEIVPVEHDEFGDVGGYQIVHGDCCPGRVDATITPPAVHLIAFASGDLRHLLAAIAGYEGDWRRRDRVVAKLERIQKGH